MTDTTAILLAAGLGTRMRSTKPKALHPIAGQPMLAYLIAACEAAGFSRVVVVTGPDMPGLAATAAPHPTVVQAERRGTAHAALQAAPLFGDGEVAVLYADNPLIEPATLRAMLDRRTAGDAALASLAMRPPDPGRYGRVISRAGWVDRIVEYADADAAERAEPLCNAGVLCATAADMARWLAAVRPDNAKAEYYLTDVVARARDEGARVAVVEAPWQQLRGVNTRAELAEAEATVQRKLRIRAMDQGATLTAPETVFFSADTRLGQDVTVGPFCVFGPGVTVADNAEILAFSHLAGCTIASGAVIGPYARLRPGTEIGRGAHVGNFVELKATTLGAGAKANHLSYLGDASIGARTNVGAGTITSNYDGFAKHRTTIGTAAFIGSDAVLVAPVTIGDGAFVTAGSVVTEDVADGAMAFGRARQINKPAAGAAFTARRGRKE